MARLPSSVLPRHVVRPHRHGKDAIRVAAILVETAALDAAGVYARLETRAKGLSAREVEARLAVHGPNVLAKDNRVSVAMLLWHTVLNPLVILLTVLLTISFLARDARAGTMLVSMIVLSVGLKLIQEARADSAAARLRAMISVKATVLRGGEPQEIPVALLVPGDVVQLAAGDMMADPCADAHVLRGAHAARESVAAATALDL